MRGEGITFRVLKKYEVAIVMSPHTILRACSFIQNSKYDYKNRAKSCIRYSSRGADYSGVKGRLLKHDSRNIFDIYTRSGWKQLCK